MVNWKPTNGKKPDLPDNQMVQVIDNEGWTYTLNVGGMDECEAFYRESPVIDKEEYLYTTIINNQRPEGLHDRDEIEVIYYDGNSSIGTIYGFLWGETASIKKLFFRLTKKYEEPKPKRVGELMTLNEWILTCTEMGQVAIKAYADYIQEQIENDR